MKADQKVRCDLVKPTLLSASQKRLPILCGNRTAGLPRAHSSKRFFDHQRYSSDAAKRVENIGNCLHLAPQLTNICNSQRSKSSAISQTCRDISLQYAEMERNERLKIARERRGFGSAAEAARRLTVPYGTYSGHESGSRGIKDSELKQYAKSFRVPLEWLAHGIGTVDGDTGGIPIYGYIGLGEEVEFLGDADHALEHIDVPGLRADDGMGALIGRGTSMYPRVNEGEVIVYRRNGKTAQDMFNREVVVKIVDGPVLFKRIRQGSEPGLYRLESHNAPPREAQIEWVGELLSIIPEGAWRKLVS